MARPKPYQRSSSDSFKRANPDAPGKWSHDLHENKTSLLSRMSNGSTKAGSSKGSLLDRISGGQGKELLPGSSSAPKLHGFGATPQNLNNANAGVELLPSGAVRPRRSEPVLNKGRLVQSGLDAALGTSLPRRQVVRPIVPERGSVNILGAGRGTVLVMVENLAVGTTAEDVVSAFAPAPVESARVTSHSSSSTVTVELEMATRQAAEDVIQRYDGAIADGNALKVAIVKQSLAERMSGGVGPVRNTKREERAVGQELLASKGSSKMYSDTILATNPSASIITLAQQEEAGRRDRAQAWNKTTPSLIDRMNGGGRRGRGQIGGGSYADMMVD